MMRHFGLSFFLRALLEAVTKGEREQTFSKTSYSTTTNQLETSPEVVKVEVIITGDEEEEEEEDNGEELERWRETITNETGRW